MCAHVCARVCVCERFFCFSFFSIVSLYLFYHITMHKVRNMYSYVIARVYYVVNSVDLGVCM